MAGKPEAFNTEENEALRASLREYRTKHQLTQKQVGKLLDIAQQNAGRLLSTAKGVGMSRQTANKLAQAMKFRDAEEFLLSMNISQAMKPAPSGARWTRRDSAVRAGRILGIDEAAIQATVQRFTGDEAFSWEVKNWIYWFGVFERELKAARATDTIEAPPKSEPTLPVAAKSKKTKSA